MFHVCIYAHYYGTQDFPNKTLTVVESWLHRLALPITRVTYNSSTSCSVLNIDPLFFSVLVKFTLNALSSSIWNLSSLS
jgi:hypothetical protein